MKYSLQHGICEESAVSFVTFAYFQIFLKQSFESGRYWGNVATKIIDKASVASTVTNRARLMLTSFVNFWFVPLSDSINHLQEIADSSFKLGDNAMAYMAAGTKLSFLFFRGEKLSILSQKNESILQSMVNAKLLSVFTSSKIPLQVPTGSLFDDTTNA